MSSPDPPKVEAPAALTDDNASFRRRSSGSTTSGENADQALEALGYKPELSRNRSTLHMTFMAAVLAAVPYGLTTTMTYPLTGGGPVTMIWGWVALSMVIMCVAASLGEITSVYPTAGGVYYQTFMIAPASWRRLASWICGWLYVVGQITITLAVNFGSTLFLVACVNVFENDDGSPIWEAEEYHVFLIFLAMTLICNLVASMGNRWLPMLDAAAMFWSLGGAVAIVISILAVAKNGRHSANYVFTHFENHSGWPDGWAFFVGIMHAGYCTSTTGMVITMCEEVHQPSIQVPRAMVGTVVFNTILGLFFLIPLAFVLPDIGMLVSLANGQPMPVIIREAVGPEGAIALLIPLIILAILCGITCTTSASRCTWAFARDGAIPGSRWWRYVHPKLDVPLNAMMLSMVVQILLAVIYFGSSEAFDAFLGVCIMCLTASYAAPIAVSVATGRKDVAKARFSLGRFGLPANIVALAWSAFAIPLFCMPTTIPVETTTVNYAPVVFVAAMVISGVWYVVWGYKNYEGPPTQEPAAF